MPFGKKPPNPVSPDVPTVLSDEVKMANPPMTMNRPSATILMVDRTNSYSPMNRTPIRLTAISIATMTPATTQSVREGQTTGKYGPGAAYSGAAPIPQASQ